MSILLHACVAPSVPHSFVSLHLLPRQEVLGQCLLVRPPDPLRLCSDPPTERSLQEADVLLTLVVGAAVQCAQREHYIGSIKNMSVPVQQAIAERVRKVSWEPRATTNYYYT